VPRVAGDLDPPPAERANDMIRNCRRAAISSFLTARISRAGSASILALALLVSLMTAEVRAWNYTTMNRASAWANEGQWIITDTDGGVCNWLKGLDQCSGPGTSSTSDCWNTDGNHNRTATSQLLGTWPNQYCSGSKVIDDPSTQQQLHLATRPK
jgi:hypothetical protein